MLGIKLLGFFFIHVIQCDGQHENWPCYCQVLKRSFHASDQATFFHCSTLPYLSYRHIQSNTHTPIQIYAYIFIANAKLHRTPSHIFAMSQTEDRKGIQMWRLPIIREVEQKLDLWI